MLLRDFYSLSNHSSGEGNFSAAVSFNASHDIFKGHFPGQPVVPGVCSIQIVKEVLGAIVGDPLVLSESPQIKFLQPITPDIQPVLELAWEEKEDVFIVTAKMITTQPVFKFQGQFIKIK